MFGLYIFFGLLAGVFGGFLGIGGGSILIPAFVYALGMSQHQAQGTTLALMVPPIGLLAALRYWQNGNVKLPVAAWACLGFFFGALLGAELAQRVQEPVLKRVFGIFLLIISIKMISGR